MSYIRNGAVSANNGLLFSPIEITRHRLRREAGILEVSEVMSSLI